MLPPARWKRGRATRCEPAGRALWCAGFHRLGSGLARWGTRDELVREEKRYRFSEARMEPSTFDTHNCDASRRGASLPRRTWPTSDPVSGRSGCGSGWLIKSRRKPSNSSEERASGKYWELLESEEPPAGVEPATY